MAHLRVKHHQSATPESSAEYTLSEHRRPSSVQLPPDARLKWECPRCRSGGTLPINASTVTEVELAHQHCAPNCPSIGFYLSIEGEPY